MMFHVHKYDVPCARKIKPIAHTSAHASHARTPSRTFVVTIHLPPLTRIPRFLLGEVPRLGLDRAESEGFIALIFLLFRDSFEGNTAIFLAVGGAAGLPGTSA